MTDLPTLKSLISRVAAASGPDRELDEALMGLFYVRDRRYIGAHFVETGERVLDDVWVDPKADKWKSTHALEFTGSIDAAVTLIERAMPGAAITWNSFDVQRSPTRERKEHVFLNDFGSGHATGNGNHSIAALAFCEALLSALISKAKPHD